MSARKLPDIDTLLAHRADGLSDQQIANLYGVRRSSASRQFRAHGHGAGTGAHNPRKYPHVEQLAQEYAHEGARALAERYGVTLSGVRNAMARGRAQGVIPPYVPPPKKVKPPREPKPKAATKPKPRPKAVRKPKPAPQPKPVPVVPGYIEPDLAGKCAARELFGSRVCDLDPHTDRRHNGAGPKDARADFYGAR